jgi:uncharacterized protein (TIGR00661 family)
MAKIIYGISGEGRGHSSRSRVIIEHLIKQGHQVKIFTSQKGYDYLSQFFDDVNKVMGLGFVFKGEKVEVLQTIKFNIKNALTKGGKSLNKLFKAVEEFKPDLAITDFEPFVPIAAKKLRIPFYSINHQNFICHSKLEYPIKWTDDFLKAYAVTDNMYQFAKKYYVTSFYFPEVKKKMKGRAINFSPILRKEVLKQKPATGKFILLYATTPEAKKVFTLLNKTKEKYVAYGFKNMKNKKNIIFKQASTEGFLKDLANCKAVITNGGYTLMSEALYLGKPIYSIPINNQFEQMINAYYLEKLGYGLYDMKANVKRLNQFIEGLDYFKKNIARNKKSFNGNNFIFAELNKILRKIRK